MALPAGRVGVAPDQVDRNGNIKSLPAAKGMGEMFLEIGFSYSLDRDTLVTFIVNGSTVNQVMVEYTPTAELGLQQLVFAGTPVENDTYDFIFTLWVPKNVEVKVLLRDAVMHAIFTYF